MTAKIFSFLLLSIKLVLLVNSFEFLKTRKYYLPSLKDNEKWVVSNDGSFSDKSDVSEVLSEIFNTLSKRKPMSVNDNVDTKEIDENVLRGEFDRIISNIRGSDSLSEQSKNRVVVEMNMMFNEAKLTGEISTPKPQYPVIDTSIPKTQLYYGKDAPYVVFYGPGPIAKDLLNRLQEFGKAIQYRAVDGSQLSVMQESELKFILKDVRTVIVAADNIIPEKKGWFGSAEEPPEVINEKGLKRLLNTAMKVRDGRGGSGIKIISLGKAAKQNRGVASFLMGDTTDFNSEFVLQCQQRGLPYLLVKVGETVSDDTNIASNDISVRDAEGPVLIQTRSSSSAGNSGKTRISHAVEALLRSVGHPSAGNCSITVLSTAQTDPPTDADWDSEFIRTAGPELMRIPLLNASPTQALAKLVRIAQGYQDRQKGTSSLSYSLLEPSAPALITPIEVTRFSNGVRVVFCPPESAYLSSKEEKEREEMTLLEKKAADAKKKKTGYISPEAEAALQLKDLMESAGREATDTDLAIKKKKKQKPEGGLEIIVDTSPSPRVRIRRCEMGPQTVVKEESEALLLRAFSRGLEVLEGDYKVVIDRLADS